jgi:hypothetical protein
MMSVSVDFLTKYPVFIGIAIGLVSALVGLLSSLLTTFFSNFSQSDRERKKWVKEKLQDIYSNSIGSLIALRETINPEIEKQHSIDAEKWLYLLLIYESTDNKKYFPSFREEVFLFAKKQWIELSNKYIILEINTVNPDIYGQRYHALTGIIIRTMGIAASDKRLH